MVDGEEVEMTCASTLPVSVAHQRKVSPYGSLWGGVPDTYSEDFRENSPSRGDTDEIKAIQYR